MSNNLADLAESINHISLNDVDLMDCVLSYSKVFSKELSEYQSEKLDDWFTNDFFLEQSKTCVREAIVLAMQALTLDSSVKFSSLMKMHINKDNQEYNIDNISSIDADRELLKEFFSGLRKEFFTKTYSQNKGLKKITKISADVLDNRRYAFVNYVK